MECGRDLLGSVVNINVNKPLCPGVFLPRYERTNIWISLKYERLPEFCFRCGIIGHTDVQCETNRVVLTNEFGRKFPAFGDWLHCGNDKTPPGLYEKPSVLPILTLMQDVPVPEVTVPALVQNTQAVQAMETAVQYENTPRTAGNDNLVHTPRIDAGNTTGEVLSFARLLEQSLKDACRANKASTSLSPINTLMVDASSECGHGTKIGHQVGPHSHNNPQSPLNTLQTKHSIGLHSHNNPPSPLNTLQTKHSIMDPPKVLLEPTRSNEASPITDPLEDHHLNLSIQSQVPCTLESSLDQLRPHTTISTEPHGTESKSHCPISPKAVLALTPLLDPENHPSPPNTPVNPPTPTPGTQAETPLQLIHQTATPTSPAIQEDIGTQDLKRKEHPNSPGTSPKKPRTEDVCFEPSCSQLWGFQLHANKVEEDCVSLVKETEMHPSPKAL
jgi:hypothetical protein